MQETRKHILDILREQGQATVDDIVDALCTRRGKEITAVTVRHHLSVLQDEALITEPELKHRSSPGRPQHVYTLTEKAHQLFPNNYQQLITGLLAQLKDALPPNEINVIFEGVADNMAAGALIPQGSQEERLNMVVEYLNQQGYDASWEASEQGMLLHTRNCPYHHLAKTDDALCSMDLRLIATLIGAVPRRVARVAEGDSSCSYLFHEAML